MKKSLVLFLFAVSSILFAQNDKVAPRWQINYSIKGGINVGTANEILGNLLIDVNAGILPQLNIYASVGYMKIAESGAYTDKSVSKFTYQGVTTFFADRYTAPEKKYDMIPISVGFQYIVKNKVVSPYAVCNAGYNFLNRKDDLAFYSDGQYDSYDKIPAEYKSEKEFIPNHSYSIGIGIGSLFHISKGLSIDLRYLYKIDSKISNSHQLLTGVSF